MSDKNNYYTSSVYNEAIRSVRTNIQFSDIDNKNRIFAITSSKPSEGKTTVIYDLAKSFAQNGDKVALLDFDLRAPKVGKVSGIETNMGVTNVITGKVSLDKALIKDQYEDNLFVLLSGPVPPNPTEILASDHVKELVRLLNGQFDYVFIDTPPVGLFTDASIVSTLCDGVIFAIKSNDTKIDEVNHALDNLKKVNAKIIGAVLTFADVKESSYKGYY
ncbi:CpsD/CapB family tyrosine-protein kinase [Anaerococcus sp. AGMB00486]|uniref:non-specific protein-tyrosine kinase n=2 Tax=Anaerococcus TaxID=165779 RepID=A0ABX2NA34_9FIRM|nr:MULTISPECIES: CpsD/CapB family tyrosine-protein kinase [Anaerococcus]MDY3006746.1 CpsD/CapB family tyrosine-protein kinase [Anaerococcus porci]MSS77688.1 CpsD/CapB family tyrosine-protein kinase [Anaerococcus porci]NVF11543.1 CpsD/CapB family tyrosine-protein kinase [Anaerococcus faecalis]